MIKKGLLLWFILGLSFSALATERQIDHIEPLSWWVGMKNPELQIMLHGDHIADLTPVIDYAGVSLVRTEVTDNSNYLFIYLTISETTKAGSVPIALYDRTRQVTKITYALESREKRSAERKGFSAKDAVYLLVPDRFANGNVKNDSVKFLKEKVNRENSGGRHGGDIQGIVDHLDYIRDMGFTQIWPTPLIENDQEDYSYHGYSATNHYKIDARFGTNESYKAMVATANKKGLGVIQDVVLNHIGSGHWWMCDLPEHNWINFPDHYTETTHRRTTLHDPHAATNDREQFASGWFVKTMPDLNQRNPRLATYLIQNTLWWIEYAHLSGVREDTYSYADKAFLARWSKAVIDEYPHFTMVGEEWTPNAAIVSSWQKGKFNTNGYVSYLPSLMDFPLQYALRDAFVESESNDTGLVKLYESLANDFLYADPLHLMVFAENHDTSRIYSAMNERLDLYKNIMTFLATTRGIPQFFYGSEVLKTSPKVRDDGAVRSDMPGGWRDDKANAFSGVGLSKEQLEAQSFLKFLLRWRKNNADLTEGKLLHYVSAQGVYVYFRIAAHKRLMVVINKNAEPLALDLTRFREGIENAQEGIDILSNTRVDLTKPLSLAAKTPVMIEWQTP